MIHARRQESGISRSRASRSDRLYRVSCLFVHFLAPFPPLSHRHLTVPFALFFSQLLPLSLLCFFMLGQRRRTENYRRYLDPYALSLFLGLVVTHTGEKRRANRQPTTREWRPVQTSPGLVKPGVLSFRLFYFLRYGVTTCVSQSSAKYQRIVIDTRVNSSFDFRRLTHHVDFTEINVRPR